jgi:RimJ/RimL family protein N-acetyltransferase
VSGPPVLQGVRLRLRSVADGDTEARLALGNHAEIVRLFGGSTRELRPLTREAASAWCDRLKAHPCAWVIEESGRLIGNARLDNIDRSDGRCTLAIGIYDPTRLGRGLGSEAIRLLLSHAFDTLKLHRVGVRVLAYNARAIRAYEKCGFIREGVEREAALVDGERHDDVMMGILAQEYRAGASERSASTPPHPNPSPGGRGAQEIGGS